MATICRPMPVVRVHAARPVVRANVVAKASAVAEPVPLTIKSLDGAEQGSVDLALKVAGADTARHVVHRYLVHVRQNARAGTACTKTRAEVRGGGRKPGPQKGSGGARKGSTRTPLNVGGGVVFGPKPKDWTISLNKKERRLAMATALQSASADMVVIEGFKSQLEGRKTKSLVNACKTVGVDVMNEYTLIITAEGGDANQDVRVAGGNIERLKINSADCLQFYDILRADRIIIEKGAVDFINTFYQ